MLQRGLTIASISTDSAKTKNPNTDFVVRLWSKNDSNQMKDPELNIFLSEVAGLYIWYIIRDETAKFILSQEEIDRALFFETKKQNGTLPLQNEAHHRLTVLLNISVQFSYAFAAMIIIAAKTFVHMV